MDRKRKTALLLISAFILIQTLPFAPQEGQPLPSEEFGLASPLLEAKCGTCHGGPVQLPGVLRLAPVSWWVSRQIHNARTRLNLAQWSQYTAAERKHLREQMLEEVESGRMPPLARRLFHPDSEVSDSEKVLLEKWVSELDS